MQIVYHPQETVQALLQTDYVTAGTKAVLQNRLDKKSVETPRFFSTASFTTLQSVCSRLIPQPHADGMVDLAGNLDENLAVGKGNGWRYDAMPADKTAFTEGLKGIDETANAQFGQPFHSLSATQQDEVLATVQTGTPPSQTWQSMPSKLFFEELLAALVEIYYSHPFAKEAINEVSFANAKGWKNIGLNKLEPPEAKR